MPNQRNLKMFQEIDNYIKSYGANIAMVDFSGLNSDKVRQLRIEIRKRDGRYKVFKNTIMRIYFQEKDFNYSNIFVGVNGFVFSNEDKFLDILKFLVKSEKNLGLKVKGSIFENKFYSNFETVELSKLVSKQELIRYVLGAINSGTSSFVSILNNVLQSFIYVLKAIEEKK